MSLRVLLVNDDRAGLQAAYGKLAGDPRIDLVGRAHSGSDAFRKMQELMPDVVLLELDVSGDVAIRMFGSPAPRRLAGMVMRDMFFRVTLGEIVAGGSVSEGFGDGTLPMIARLFTVDEARGSASAGADQGQPRAFSRLRDPRGGATLAERMCSSVTSRP